MSKHVMRHCAVMVALALCANAAATTTDYSTTSSATTPATTGQTSVAGKVAHPFVTLAGSQENAVALANALRTGTPATLTYTSTDANGQPATTTTMITPPTKPMGWGNVSHSLALAQFALNKAGITDPTSAELQTALQGGSIMTADGKTVTFAGVLQQRADGMGWGRIAQSYGTTMGSVNRSIKAPAAAIAATSNTASKATTTVSASKVTTSTGITTADGARVSAPGRGLTTAVGTSGGHGAKGLTTASGATSGSSAGVTTGKGGATAGIVTADPGHGAGSGSGNGKGKGGG